MLSCVTHCCTPSDFLRLPTLLDPRQSVLLVVDDMSRPTPVREVLDGVLDELHRAGVQKSQVRILIALGTHRFMTEQEIEARFGTAIAGSYRDQESRMEQPVRVP